MMMACQSSTHLSPVVPANLLEPCADLQQLSGTKGKDVMLWSIDTVAKYNDCKSKHGAIVKAIN